MHGGAEPPEASGPRRFLLASRRRLRLTEGDKAAAEALGLSRQSLYLKIHRSGLP
jgi:hypothetical protein